MIVLNFTIDFNHIFGVAHIFVEGIYLSFASCYDNSSTHILQV